MQFFEKYPLVKFLFFKGVKEEESLTAFDNLSFLIMKRTIVGYSKTPNYKYGIDSLMETLVEDQNFIMMDKMGIEKAVQLVKNSIYIESEINADYDFNVYDPEGTNKYVEMNEDKNDDEEEDEIKKIKDLQFMRKPLRKAFFNPLLRMTNQEAKDAEEDARFEFIPEFINDEKARQKEEARQRISFYINSMMKDFEIEEIAGEIVTSATNNEGFNALYEFLKKYNFDIFPRRYLLTKHRGPGWDRWEYQSSFNE